ncbi:dihydrofolate reductase family protein [Pseudokineococcus basanitobsidens]|uniref:Dihydrofolate reductase family protein n=1 Tax=Pseudokineococcus basanitobsidens TaxID=1926649 RepID=A0ABU8RPV1_9ACTN
MTTPRTWRASVFIATSIDGYIALPDGDIDWLTDPPHEPRHVPSQPGEHPPPDYEQFTAGISHLVMGRGTYDKVLTFDSWPYEAFRVLVLSTTLPDGDDPRITVVRSTTDAQQLLDDDRATGVYVDGGQVLTDFLRHGLVDELTITRAPVILGQGLPLFHDLPEQVRLVHRGTASLGAGMVSTRYDVTRDDQHER